MCVFTEGWWPRTEHANKKKYVCIRVLASESERHEDNHAESNATKQNLSWTCGYDSVYELYVKIRLWSCFETTFAYLCHIRRQHDSRFLRIARIWFPTKIVNCSCEHHNGLYLHWWRCLLGNWQPSSSPVTSQHECRYTKKYPLNVSPLAPHICVSDSGQHWFR